MGNAIETQATISQIDINTIVPMEKGNTRKKTNPEKRALLKSSIQELGLLQPIAVRPHPKDPQKFELLAGYTRWELCKEIGFEKIDVSIKLLNDAQALEANLSENLIREDLSLVDEARAAQRLMSECEGKASEVSGRLGWSEKKVKDRLQLMRCCEIVLEALSNDEIKLGHAIKLSSFSEKLQTGTLAKIIAENWTVEYLSQRAGAAQKYLSNAAFDTTECQQCPNNTVMQSDMFEIGNAEQAKCAKLSCWTEKTSSFLEQKKTEAIQKFGKVLMWFESSDKDRNTVSSSVVGEKQFNSGCQGCESKVVVMDDRDRQEGQIIESQCVDVTCFSSCVEAFNKPVKVQSDELKSSDKGEKVPDEATTNVVKAPTKQKTPSSVTEHEKDVIREASYISLQNNPTINLSLIMCLVSDLSGYQPEGTETCSQFHKTMSDLMKLSPETLSQEIEKGIAHYFTQKKVDSFGHNKCPRNLLIKLLSTTTDAKAVAQHAWTADVETLTNYQVGGVIGLCTDAGFDVAFDNCPNNQAKKLSFSKISKMKKPEFINAITGFSFDWSDYAPDSFLTHI
jgi:ParB family chromosome partitioning protein